MHFCFHGQGGAAFLQMLVDEINGWVDAFFRRSPHLDEQADPSESADPPRFSAHDLPILIPPPR